MLYWLPESSCVTDECRTAIRECYIISIGRLCRHLRDTFWLALGESPSYVCQLRRKIVIMNYCYFVTFVFCTYLGHTSIIVSACNMQHEFKSAASSVEKTYNQAVNATKEALKVAGEKISEGVKNALNTTRETLKIAGEKINEVMNKAKDFVVKAWGTSKQKLQFAGHEISKEVEKGETVIEDYFKNIMMNSCMCENYNCGCCAHLEEADIHLNSTICTNVTYLVHDYGISFTITVNGYAIYNETISARNPPPVCLGVPYVKELADLCIRLYEIDATPTSLHACVRIEARMKNILIAKYELGCFDIGPPRATPVTSTTTSRPPFTENANERKNKTETGSMLPLVLSMMGIVVLAIISLVIIRIRKDHSRGYRLMKNLNTNYGSTNSLAPSSDPFC